MNEPARASAGRITTRVEPGPRAEMVLYALLAMAAYFASARIGYRFAIPQGVVTLWPPSGVMLGLLLLSPRRYWPALAIGGLAGSFASDMRSGYSPALAVAAALANSVESVAAAWFLTWRLGSRVRLSSLTAVVTFTAGAAVLVNALTACFGALMLNLGFHTPFVKAWFVWWVGDGLGILIITPVFLALAAPDVRRRAWTTRVVFEAAVLLTLLFGVAQAALGPRHDWPVEPGPYAVFPLLFWAALRFGGAGAALASLVLAAVATWNAALGAGPFFATGSSGVSAAMQAYAYLAVASLSSLISAAVLEERTVAGERLVESEARYRAVMAAATDAVITMDENGRIDYANAATARVLGFTASELTGGDLALLLPAHFADNDDAGARPFLLEQKERGWQVTTLTGRHRDGHDVLLEASFGELATDGHHVFTAILRDTSERRAAERALRAAEDRMRFAFEASGVGVWEVDMVTGATRWSETLEALHGLSAGTFGGTHQAFLDLIHPDDRRLVFDAIAQATHQHSDAHIAYRTTWTDGSVHWIRGVGRTFYDAAGTPVRATGIGLDVTKERNLEDQYRQSQKMEAVGQLAGGVAHDFNNLLMAIRGYSSLLTDALAPDSPLHADLAEIVRAAQRAASLTRQLLAFSRQQILAPSVLDLSDSLRAIVPMLTRLIGEDIDIVVRTPPDVWHVKADAGQIEQVILNLALNARDAMPDGGTLQLEVMHVDACDSREDGRVDAIPGACVLLAVTDTGVGMDAATAARVFEPFFTTKPAERGTGLGLSTVHGIVNQSGGRVWVYSEPGHGTTFKVYLPRVDAPLDVAPPDHVAEPERVSETVLVVEDEEVLRQLTRRVLEMKGYRVFVAATPHDALNIVEAHTGQIHILLTDVVMPQMNGRVLAEQVLARDPGIRVVFMSGYTDDALVRRGVLDRDMNFIQKPFSQDALLRLLRTVLTARSLDHQLSAQPDVL